jgi:hypothetical protein
MFKKRSGCSRKQRLIHGKNPDVPKKNLEVQKLPEFKPKRSRGTPRSGCSQKIRMFFKNPEVSKKSGCLKKDPDAPESIRT